MTYFVGVDIGTTSTKAIIFSPAGVVKGMAIQGYPLLAPQPGWSEQDPEALLTAATTTIREAIAQANLSAQEISAVGLSVAMHSLIVMDRQGYPLTNSITWADSRSVDQAERLKGDRTGFTIYQRTGTPIHPMSPLLKLIWLKEQEPDIFSKAAKFISIKEYILYHWFDRYIVDYSIASATGLFNLQSLCWDDEALALAGIRQEQLSELVPTTYVLRGMKARYAELTGLHPDTPMVVGASDGVLANLGVGAIGPEQIAVTIGTSGAVRRVVPTPITDQQGRTFCYALTEHHWVIGGASNSGGIVFRWFRDRFGQAEIAAARQQNRDPYDLLIQRAETVPAGAEGLLFLPFLSGERAPYWNSNAKGVFFGVALHHERAHFVRAVLEGILFSAYDITAVLQTLTSEGKNILASGGFARSKVWRQMMADVFGSELLVPEIYEASGFGAAVLAMYAIGAITSLSEVQPLIRIRDRHLPNRELTQQYRELFQIYQSVYLDSVEEFAKITAIQRRRSQLDRSQ